MKFPGVVPLHARINQSNRVGYRLGRADPAMITPPCRCSKYFCASRYPWPATWVEITRNLQRSPSGNPNDSYFSSASSLVLFRPLPRLSDDSRLTSIVARINTMQRARMCPHRLRAVPNIFVIMSDRRGGSRWQRQQRDMSQCFGPILQLSPLSKEIDNGTVRMTSSRRIPAREPERERTR